MAIAALTSELACPVCHGPLGEPWTCRQCEQRFPAPGGFPVIVPNPERYLAREVAQLRRHVTERTRHLQAIESILAVGSLRAPVLGPLRTALGRNLHLIEEELADLSRVTSLVSESSAAGDARSGGFEWGADVLGCVQTDWASTEEGERQVGTVLAAIRPFLEAYSDAEGPCVVIGGGAGRYFHELTRRYRRIWGCDLSYTYVDVYHRLRRGPLALSEIFLPELAGDTVAVDFTAEMTGYSDASDAYVVADAGALPCEDGRTATLLSVYFSDCMSAVDLFREARRVLRAGGVLVSYGPLFYRAVSPELWFTPTEILTLARQAGFEVLADEWSELVYRRSAHAGMEMTHRVWTFVVRRP